MSSATAGSGPTEPHQPTNSDQDFVAERKGVQCAFHGCMRVYMDTDSLKNHAQGHHIHTKSLPGKTLLCSFGGCNGSFPSMQELMMHMRYHYKPNIYFQCESCRSKLRTYPALLKHLHTCAKMAKGKAGKTAEQSNLDLFADPTTPLIPNSEHNPNPNPNADPRMSSMATDSSNAQQPQHGSDSAPHPLPSQVQLPEDSLSLLSASSTAFSQPDAQIQAQSQSLQSQPQNQTQTQDLPQDQDHPQSQPQDLPQSQSPQQDQQDQPSLQDLPALMSQTSPGSNAVWRKNQGVSFNSRILWEHTRGRYKCIQCGQFAANRQEITAHIENHHKSPVPSL